MTNSTKRTIRTVFQLVIALIVAAPVLATALHGTPVDVQVTAFAAIVAVVAKVVNALEDAGVIPAWLKDEPKPRAKP